jgi:hypothetical protein
MARYTDRRKQEIARRDAAGWGEKFRKDEKCRHFRETEPLIPVRIDERTVICIRESRFNVREDLFEGCHERKKKYLAWWNSHKNLHLV